MIKNYLFFICMPLKVDKSNYIKMLFAAVFLGIYPGLFALVLNKFIQEITIDQGKAIIIITILAILLVVKPIICCLNSFWAGRLKDNIGKKQNELLINKINRLEYVEIENENSYELLSRIGNNLDDEFFERTNSCLYALEVILNYYSLVAFVSTVNIFLSAVIAVLFIPLSIVGYKCGFEKYTTKKKVTEIKRKTEYLEKILIEREYAAEKTLFGFSNEYTLKWYENFRFYKKKEAKTKFLNTVNMEKIGLLSNGIFLGTIFFLAKSGMNTLNFAPCIAMASQAITFSGSIRWGVMDLFQSMIDNKMYMEDWKSFLFLPEVSKGGEHKTPTQIEKIEFINVSFSYPNTEKLILDNLNAVFESGKTYVIVGENGAGKSTMVKLLLGFYGTYKGEIKINNRELKTYSQENLKELFGVLFQDSVCFPISIERNITSSDPEEKKLMDVISKAGLKPKIDSLPQKLETIIGKLHKGDEDFSGGERKRISIARVLYKNSSVYILDEPTSSIDPIYEDEINKLLTEQFHADINIIISHRLGIATRADEIMVLGHGKIEEKGRHDELLLKGGIYSEMFNKQKERYVEES